jgi:hypothetical protein
MALSAQSLFVYGIQITPLNGSIDFKISGGGSELHAQLTAGFYSVGELATEISVAMTAADPTHIYTVTVLRNISGGTQNRIKIQTDGSFLSILFGSGTNVSNSVASIAGFNQSDYTGSTNYTSSSTAGTSFLPDYIGYNYTDDINTAKVFGAVNVSASGVKESITFNIQKFITVNFMYETKTRLQLIWYPFFIWSIQQRPFEFTPEVSFPDTVYNVTLENTTYDGRGLGFQMSEMLPNFPNRYQTGLMKFRIVLSASQFVTSV